MGVPSRLSAVSKPNRRLTCTGCFSSTGDTWPTRRQRQLCARSCMHACMCSVPLLRDESGFVVGVNDQGVARHHKERFGLRTDWQLMWKQHERKPCATESRMSSSVGMTAHMIHMHLRAHTLQMGHVRAVCCRSCSLRHARMHGRQKAWVHSGRILRDKRCLFAAELRNSPRTRSANYSPKSAAN